jgi:hypothetical protein
MVVLATAPVTYVGHTDEEDARLIWVGKDHRGLELSVVALDLPEQLLVIHVMPNYRKGDV